MEQSSPPANVGSMERLGLREWLVEREENCLRIAGGMEGRERDGWLEDAMYFRAAYLALDGLQAAADAVAEAHKAAQQPRARSSGMPHEAEWDDGYLNGVKACGTVVLAAMVPRRPNEK